MSQKIYNITLLTPLLCHGAEKTAELRVPSIRGLLRIWHKILWGQADVERCWGGLPPEKEPVPSKVVLRILPENMKEADILMLPHKKGPAISKGYVAGEKFQLAISFRHLPEDEEQKKQIIDRVEKTIKAWLLLGTCGQRGTRAFGSVWYDDFAISSIEDFSSAVNELFAESSNPYAVQLYSGKEKKIELKDCTDTLGGNPELFGSISPRRNSPLKMKYIKLGQEYYLVLHAQKHDIIDNAVSVLKEKNKPIGTKYKLLKKITGC